MQNAILAIILAALAAVAVLAAIRRLRHGSACCGERESAPKRVAVADHSKAHYPYAVELQIGGMTCESCARRVENALNTLEGTWATVRIDTHKALVRTKAAPDEVALREAVRQAGYVVSAIRPRK